MTDTVPGTPIPPPPPQPPNVSADLYKAVIGPVNQAGYLRHFAQFDALGKTGPTWHWAAFLSALNWLLFRGMWGTALLYAAGMLTALLGLLGIGKLAYDFSDPTALLLLAGLIGLSSVLAGLYAHAAYYRFCKKQIVLTVGLASSMQDARKRLQDQASTSRRLYVLVGLNTALLCALLWGSALIQQAGLVHTRPDTPGEPPPLPVVDASAPAFAPAHAPALAPASAPVATASMPASTPVSEPASAPASAPAASGPVTTRYFVQVGVFAVENNALTLQEKLEAAGFRVHTLGLNTPKGVLIQVRMGPFGTKPEADDIALQLRAMDLPTYVFKFQPGVTP